MIYSKCITEDISVHEATMYWLHHVHIPPPPQTFQAWNDIQEGEVMFPKKRALPLRRQIQNYINNHLPEILRKYVFYALLE